MNVRLEVIEMLIERIAAIRKSATYATDAGKQVFVGETPQLGEGDPEDAVAIVFNDTQPQPNQMERWPIEIQALCKADVTQPYLAALRILGDVVKAVELGDTSLGGVVKSMEVGPQRTLRREPGSTTVGIAQTYYLTYVRRWGLV